MDNEKLIKVLILEDSPTDAELTTRKLGASGLRFTSKRVQTRDSFINELRTYSPSIILADYKLPNFDGISALKLAREICPEVPLIIVSGVIGEEKTVEALRMGATDYVLKDNLQRLVPSVKRALGEAEERVKLIAAELELKQYHEHLEQLVKERTAKLTETNDALQSERDKLISVLNSMEDGVCIMKPDFSIEYVNPSMQALYGDTNGQECFRYFNGRKDQCPWCNNKEVFAGKTIQGEVQSSRTGRTYEVADVQLKNTDGSVSKLSIWHDITERKKVEQLKDEFIGMVSHELKTPLTVIMGSLATATDQRISPKEARELLGDAVIHAGIMANMVDNLLELSRQQSDRLVLQTKSVNVGGLVQTVLNNLRSKSEIHNLVSDVPLNLAPIQADPLRVERILYNLVDNAIKYSPNGGEVKVTVSPNTDFQVIGISDQGPGITSDDQARLFQSFERLGAAVKGAIQGTGLGLRVCRILVEAHGGTMWIESEKGKGSTFFFTLPVAKQSC